MEQLISSSKLWSATFNLAYTKQKKYDYLEKELLWEEKFQLNTATTLKISEKWKLSYRVGFDLIKQVMGSQSYTFTRNLHCWSFNFKWIPGRSYFLHIYVTKPELKDIKLESRSRKYRNTLWNK